ncbi:hypothetical protein [Spongorhabdus nitratireducens]
MKFFTLSGIQALRLFLISFAVILTITSADAAVPLENLPWEKKLTFKNTNTGTERHLALGTKPVIKQKATSSQDTATPVEPSDFEVGWTVSGDQKSEGKGKISVLVPSPQLRPSTFCFHSDVGDERGKDEISAILLICRMLFNQELESKKPVKYGDTSPLTGTNALFYLVDTMSFGWSFPGNKCDLRVKVAPAFQKKITCTFEFGAEKHSYELTWESKSDKPVFLTKEMSRSGFIVSK